MMCLLCWIKLGLLIQQKAALTAGSTVNAAAHFLMYVKRFYEYFCRNMQENEELLQRTRGEIELRVSKNV